MKLIMTEGASFLKQVNRCCHHDGLEISGSKYDQHLDASVSSNTDIVSSMHKDPRNVIF